MRSSQNIWVIVLRQFCPKVTFPAYPQTPRRLGGYDFFFKLDYEPRNWNFAFKTKKVELLSSSELTLFFLKTIFAYDYEKKGGLVYEKSLKKTSVFDANSLIENGSFCQIMNGHNIKYKGNPLYFELCLFMIWQKLPFSIRLFASKTGVFFWTVFGTRTTF